MPEGKEQFRRMITQLRNLHVIAAMRPLVVMRTEMISNDELLDRGGTDDPTRLHFLQHLLACDKMRRHVTHNPDETDLGTKIALAIDPEGKIEEAKNPFGGDDIQNMSGGLIDLLWAFDGSDPNIPLNSQLDGKFMQSVGGMLLGAIDRALVNWTRCNSRDRTRFITRFDSMRMYGNYQEVYTFALQYLGDENRIDVAQVLPSDEPLGPTDSPNIKGESSNTT